MFDFRYHVASLAAVFVALVIGIVVGVGLSGRGFVDDAERENLTERIAGLERERDAATAKAEGALRSQQALEDYSDRTYATVVGGRLRDERVAVLFVGSVDQGVSFAIASAVRDAGGTVTRTRSIIVPVDPTAVREALGSRPALAQFAQPDALDALGDALGRELVSGGETPLWDAVDGVLVEERVGSSERPADAVVVVRTAAAQHGPSGRLLTALYEGLARSGVPAVGVEARNASPSAISTLAQSGLSTVDAVDTSAGRLALALLLAGAQPGSYGIGPGARDGVLPPVTPSERTP